MFKITKIVILKKTKCRIAQHVSSSHNNLSNTAKCRRLNKNFIRECACFV